MSSSENLSRRHGSSGKRKASDEYEMAENDLSRQQKRPKTNAELSAPLRQNNAGQVSSTEGSHEHHHDRTQNIPEVSKCNEEHRGRLLT